MENILYYLPVLGVIALLYVLWKNAWVSKQDEGEANGYLDPHRKHTNSISRLCLHLANDPHCPFGSLVSYWGTKAVATSRS